MGNLSCLACGHVGDQENPLAIQGTYTIPYCHDCMKLAELAAARTIKNSKWYIEWNKENSNGES